MNQNALDVLADYIRQNGPVKTARVSSAQARGFAKKFSYWGVAPYEIRLSKDGRIINAALGRARSQRRSYSLAVKDCQQFCNETGSVRLQRIGQLTEADATKILRSLESSETSVAR